MGNFKKKTLVPRGTREAMTTL